MNPTILVLHFSDFSTIFYGFYNFQPKHQYYLRTPLHAGHWKVSDSREYAPGLRKSPWKDLGARNWVPRHGRRRLGPKSGEVAAGVGGERWGKGSGPHRRPICGLVGGEGWTAEGAPRLSAAATAGAAAPARGRHRLRAGGPSSSRAMAGKGRRARRTGERAWGGSSAAGQRAAAAHSWWRGGVARCRGGGPARRGEGTAHI
jgi:hypothetical protein